MTVRTPLGGEQPLRSAFDRAAALVPGAVARAQAELDVTLAPMRASAIGATAWRSSRLTPTAFPVELAVTSASDELRTAVEVVAPEEDRAAAFPRALSLATCFGADGADPAHVELLRDAQRGRVLRFGAWLGSRHGANGTRHKVYVEVPADPAAAWAIVDRLAPDARRVVGGLGPVRFVGLHLDGSRGIEVYVRARSLGPHLLAAVCGRAGLGDRAEALVEAMSARPDHPGRPGFSGSNHGVSVAVRAGDIAAVAGFTWAHARTRTDLRTRRAVLARARAERWPSTHLYQRLTRPLDQIRPLRRPYHGALSEVVHAGRDVVEHHVGLAPPATDDVDGPTRGCRRTHHTGALR